MVVGIKTILLWYRVYSLKNKHYNSIIILLFFFILNDEHEGTYVFCVHLLMRVRHFKYYFYLELSTSNDSDNLENNVGTCLVKQKRHKSQNELKTNKLL